MPKKERSAAQLANDQRLRDKSKVKEPKEEVAQSPQEDKEVHIAPDQSVTALEAQIEEMKANMEIMRQAMLNNSAPQAQKGLVIDEVEKYIIDPSNYPDPTPRLAEEKKLQTIAFKHNYEMVYSVSVSSYQTQSGTYMKEPKFRIQLNRVVLDDQGEQTKKRYIARILTFHEDPEAAMVIARDNGLTVDRSDEKLFLNEMRYYRVRDWLLSIFWPVPPEVKGKIQEEVIGGSVVQVFTKSSEEPSGIDFDKIDKKLTV